MYQEEINGKEIIISEGGASIIDEYGDLSLPSSTFDDIINKQGYDVHILKAAIIRYYEAFFNTTV